jgi:hypothetical protein
MNMANSRGRTFHQHHLRDYTNMNLVDVTPEPLDMIDIHLPRHQPANVEQFFAGTD